MRFEHLFKLTPNWPLLLLILLCSVTEHDLKGQPVYAPASQAEVDAGVNRFKAVTPYTLTRWGGIGGATGAVTVAQLNASSNAAVYAALTNAIATSNGKGTNTTFRGVTFPALTASRIIGLNASGDLTNGNTTLALTDNFFRMGISNLLAAAGLSLATNNGVLWITNLAVTNLDSRLVQFVGGISNAGSATFESQVLLNPSSSLTLSNSGFRRRAAYFDDNQNLVAALSPAISDLELFTLDGINTSQTIQQQLDAIASSGTITNIPADKLIWVDATHGNDSTGARTNQVRPFATITAAKNKALSGDTIIVRPGTYNEFSLLKNGVNYFLNSGVKITNYTANARGGYGIFDDRTNGPVICSIWGAGDIVIGGDPFTTNFGGAFVITNKLSQINARLNSIHGSWPGGLAIQGFAALHLKDGTNRFVVDFIDSDNFNDAIAGAGSEGFNGIYWEDGESYVNVGFMRVDGYCYWGEEPDRRATNNIYMTGDKWYSASAAVYHDGASVATPIASAGWKAWVMVKEINGAVGCYTGGKQYVICEKINSAGLAVDLSGGGFPEQWIWAQKIESSGSYAINGSVGNQWIFCPHIIYTGSGQAINFTGGTNFVSGHYLRVSDGRGIYHSGGDTRIEGIEVDSRGTTGITNFPIQVEGSGLHLKNVSTRSSSTTSNAISAYSAQTVTIEGIVSTDRTNSLNVTLDGSVTNQTGALQVNGSLFMPSGATASYVWSAVDSTGRGQWVAPSGGGGGTNYPPAITTGSNIVVGTGVRKLLLFPTNQDTIISFNGTEILGEVVTLVVTNTSNSNPFSNITVTVYQDGAPTTFFDVSQATNQTSFFVASNSVKVITFVYNGTYWFTESILGKEMELAAGSNITFTTNALGKQLTISSTGGATPVGGDSAIQYSLSSNLYGTNNTSAESLTYSSGGLGILSTGTGRYNAGGGGADLALTVGTGANKQTNVIGTHQQDIRRSSSPSYSLAMNGTNLLSYEHQIVNPANGNGHPGVHSTNWSRLATTNFSVLGGSPASGKVLISDGGGAGTWQYINPGVQTLTAGGPGSTNFTIDFLALGGTNDVLISLTANSGLLITNASSGPVKELRCRILQDSTGNRTLVHNPSPYGPNFRSGIDITGINLTTNAGYYDLVYLYNVDTNAQLVRNLRGFAP